MNRRMVQAVKIVTVFGFFLSLACFAQAVQFLAVILSKQVTPIRPFGLNVHLHNLAWAFLPVLGSATLFAACQYVFFKFGDLHG